MYYLTEFVFLCECDKIVSLENSTKDAIKENAMNHLMESV